jgi:hypothetical protein
MWVNNINWTHCCVAMATMAKRTCHNITVRCIACIEFLLRVLTPVHRILPSVRWFRVADRGFGREQFFASPPSPTGKGEPGNNLYSKPERLSVGCRGTWALSVRVNLYKRQIMVLSRKTKTYATHLGPGAHSGLPGPPNLYYLPSAPLSSVMQWLEYKLEPGCRDFIPGKYKIVSNLNRPDCVGGPPSLSHD